MTAVRARVLCVALLSLVGFGAFGPVALAQVDFGSLAVAASETEPVTVTIPRGGSFDRVAVVTKGAPNLDFTDANGGTCVAGSSYPAGATCTVMVSFVPKHPGTRYGAVVLTNAAGVVATAYLQGTGVGELTNSTSSTPMTISGDFGGGITGLAADAAASVYVADGGCGVPQCPAELHKLTLSAGGYTASIIGSGLQPNAVAVDGAGNVYVGSGSTVYKLTLVNGTYQQSALASGFVSPLALAVDGAADVYVVDQVVTFNGTNTIYYQPVYKEALSASGYTQSLIDGSLEPTGVAVDGDGVIYLADTSAPTGSNSIYKETPTGNGYARSVIASGFSSPGGVAVDGIGNVYVADETCGIAACPSGLYKLTSTGAGYTTSTLELGAGVGVAVDGQGNIYYTDGSFVYELQLAQAAPPLLNPEPGTYTTNVLEVGITIGANIYSPTTVIYYTTDGSTPTTSSQPCAALGGCPGTIVGITKSTTFKAFVAVPGLANSPVVTASYVLMPPAPVFSPAGGTYNGVQMVTITSSTPGATIYYTTDGSTPTANSLVYSQPLSVNESLTINAIAVFPGDGPSAVATSSYTIEHAIGIISTVVGNGTHGYSGDNGTATAAEVNYPWGVAADANGNLYIADAWNCRVRKVTPAGVISTVAGNGTQGYSGDGGPATDAELAEPSGLTIDLSGNLYIADTGNHRIRKVTPAGVISTVAGNGIGGYGGDGGAATNAELYYPADVAVDASGNLYIADSDNNMIRKVTPAGVISTVAGLGTAGYGGDGVAATSTALNVPLGVALDSVGNLYIADAGNNRIRKVTPAGVILTVAGNGIQGYSGDGGAATNAELNSPYRVAVDTEGNLYMSDAGNQVIRKVTAAGAISTVAGNGIAGFSGDGAAATKAQLHLPVGVTVDGSGNLYIADEQNNRIRKVTFTSNYQPVGNLDEAVDSVSSKASIPQNDSVYISGWAADPVDGAPLITVKVYIDGVSAGTPTLGIARLDVANAYNNPAYTNSGFVLAYPASSLSVGSHTVTVSATDSAGTVAWFNTLTINVVAAPKPPVGNFDLAVDNVTASEPVHQSDILYTQGWGADYQANGAVATVSIVIDGTPVGNATLGQSRPDVAAYFNNPPWANTGWVYSMSAANLSAGSHTITAYATDHTGLVTWLNTLTVTVVP